MIGYSDYWDLGPDELAVEMECDRSEEYTSVSTYVYNLTR